MKQIIPIMLIASAPLTGMAQNKSGIVVDNLDKTTNPTEDFISLLRAVGRRTTRFRRLIHASAASTSCRKTTTNALTPFFQIC